MDRGTTPSPASPSVPLGIGQQLVATGTYSDASTQDLTAAVSWISSDPSVGLVSNAPGSPGAFTSLAVRTTML